MPAIRGAKSKKKTRRHTRDVDQIHADLQSPRHLARFLNSKLPEDLPALGQFYCTECSKWFDAEVNLESHKRGKPHKRRQVCSLPMPMPMPVSNPARVKQMQEEPHTQKEADAAIGLRTDNGQRPATKVDEMLIER
jgi:bud site selection protein 20